MLLESRKATANSLVEVQLCFPLSEPSMQLAAEVLNQRLGPDSFFRVTTQNKEDLTNIPSTAKRAFLLEQLQPELWAVIIFKPENRTAYTFDGVGQLGYVGLGQ